MTAAERMTLRRSAGRALRRVRTAGKVGVGLWRTGRLGQYLRAAAPPRDAEETEREAVRWLQLAFHGGGDAGASAGYHVVAGWDRPYPEITGYTIPTLLMLGSHPERAHLNDIALHSGQWLAECRLPNGATIQKQVQPGNVTPSVFNTGQVIEGWLALHRETGADEWLELAKKAGRWLVEMQEVDGSWVRFSYHGIPHTYYARVAWPLAALGVASGEQRFVDAARLHLDWVVSRQEADGWIRQAGFDASGRANTHTFAYVLEGLLGAGLVLGDDGYVDACRRGASGLRRLYDGRQFLPGELEPGFRSEAKWRCLTGDAQTALVWARLFRVTRDETYRSAAIHMLDDLRRAIRIHPDWPEVSGALPGSLPHWGDYDPYRYPTHATKFLLDLVTELADD